MAAVATGTSDPHEVPLAQLRDMTSLVLRKGQLVGYKVPPVVWSDTVLYQAGPVHLLHTTHCCNGQVPPSVDSG